MSIYMEDVVERLRDRGIQPSAQRIAIASYVLGTDEHPTVEQVLERVRENFPYVSRATVYNTLNLFVERGLLRRLVLAPGRVVYDPRVEPHHHFLDEESGQVFDVPWEALQVTGVEGLKGLQVEDYQVVLRGRRAS